MKLLFDENLSARLVALLQSGIPAIVASGIAMQFGAQPLFSDVAVKFGGGNRYGLIGANGCGPDLEDRRAAGW